MTPPIEEYKVIKPEDPLDTSHPRERVVYIKRTLKNLNFAENGSIEECVFLGCNIISMGIIKPFGFETELTFRKCIFYGCTIDLMEIQGEKIKEISELSFINCKINNLVLDDIYAPGIYFMDCEINNSNFNNSTLPGLTFTKFDQEQFEDIIDKAITGEGESAKEAKNQIRRYSSKNKHKRESEIRRSEFLFCELNDTTIEDTAIAETAIRHCHMECLKILQNVVMQDVDLRGTKILGEDLGPIQFKNIRFNKDFFLIKIIFFILSIPLGFNKYIVAKFKGSIKKVLYKNCRLHFLVNALSSTEIKHTFYGEADFSNDFQFFRYIKHLEYVDNFKKLHPNWAFFSFITTNYMRSIGGLVWWSILGILLFSLLYSCCGKFDVYPQNTGKNCTISTPVDDHGHPQEPTYLSFAIFMNNDLYPLVAGDNCTKIIIVLEVSFGYIVLGVFVGILASKLSQRLNGNKRRPAGKY